MNFAVQASSFVITEAVSGALQRAAHRRAKRQAWSQALQRIPEDNYIDYAAYVYEQPDLLDAWKSGSWHPGRGATLPEFGLIHIREFGLRPHATIKALKPGPRPEPGPNNGFTIGWPVEVLRKLPPLANPVPRVPGVNDVSPAQIRRQKRLRRRGTPNAEPVVSSLAAIPQWVWIAGAGALAYFVFGKKSGGNVDADSDTDLLDAE